MNIFFFIAKNHFLRPPFTKTAHPATPLPAGCDRPRPVFGSPAGAVRYGYRPSGSQRSIRWSSRSRFRKESGTGCRRPCRKEGYALSVFITLSRLRGFPNSAGNPLLQGGFPDSGEADLENGNSIDLWGQPYREGI
jgi:hypothetical protein